MENHLSEKLMGLLFLDLRKSCYLLLVIIGILRQKNIDPS